MKTTRLTGGLLAGISLLLSSLIVFPVAGCGGGGGKGGNQAATVNNADAPASLPAGAKLTYASGGGLLVNSPTSFSEIDKNGLSTAATGTYVASGQTAVINLTDANGNSTISLQGFHVTNGNYDTVQVMNSDASSTIASWTSATFAGGTIISYAQQSGSSNSDPNQTATLLNVGSYPIVATSSSYDAHQASASIINSNAYAGVTGTTGTMTVNDITPNNSSASVTIQLPGMNRTFSLIGGDASSQYGSTAPAGTVYTYYGSMPIDVWSEGIRGSVSLSIYVDKNGLASISIGGPINASVAFKISNSSSVTTASAGGVTQNNSTYNSSGASALSGASVFLKKGTYAITATASYTDSGSPSDASMNAYPGATGTTGTITINSINADYSNINVTIQLPNLNRTIDLVGKNVAGVGLDQGNGPDAFYSYTGSQITTGSGKVSFNYFINGDGSQGLEVNSALTNSGVFQNGDYSFFSVNGSTGTGGSNGSAGAGNTGGSGTGGTGSSGGTSGSVGIVGATFTGTVTSSYGTGSPAMSSTAQLVVTAKNSNTISFTFNMNGYTNANTTGSTFTLFDAGQGQYQGVISQAPTSLTVNTTDGNVHYIGQAGVNAGWRVTFTSVKLADGTTHAVN